MARGNRARAPRRLCDRRAGTRTRPVLDRDSGARLERPRRRRTQRRHGLARRRARARAEEDPAGARARARIDRTRARTQRLDAGGRGAAPMNAAFLCSMTRTPFGRYGGALAGVRTDDLAALPIMALMK